MLVFENSCSSEIEKKYIVSNLAFAGHILEQQVQFAMEDREA